MNEYIQTQKKYQKRENLTQHITRIIYTEKIDQNKKKKDRRKQNTYKKYKQEIKQGR